MNKTKQLAIISTLVCTALAAGCANVTSTQPGVLTNLVSEASNSYENETSLAPASPQYLEQYLDENKRTGLRDQVLINMKAGVAAMEAGDHYITRRLMEDAYNRIETVYADNKAAKAARSNYVEEANKDFKGEPYERAMVGYYLGLADMLNGDLQSAKSSFSWGEYQDTMAADQKFQGDMNSLVFLKGWAKKCDGEIATARTDFANAGVPSAESASLLVLIESGKAPVKYATGEHSEILKFKSADGDYPSSIKVTYGQQEYSPATIEDLVFQASTRGGRKIDSILAGKAEFKDTTEDMADAAMTGAVVSSVVAQASAFSGDFDSATAASGIGAFFAIASLVSDAVSENTVPEADTRQWSNLPRYLHIQPISVDTNAELSEVLIKGPKGLQKVKPMKTGSCYLAWQRV